KPSDLIPELQGRLPIRVELEALSAADLVRILQEPENALVRQYSALLAGDGLALHFTQDGVRRIAEIAQQVNERVENIGARRLHTVMERLLEEVAFVAPDGGTTALEVDAAYVDSRLKDLAQDEDLSRYIL
ncbi:MAG: HslU--HslV peptidase ATPase subunit, partial [Gammaproteobacteria bacterium]|nr:HslU--HslV peptidase ATPase subunit [Gammaproteobacteria bacterium]